MDVLASHWPILQVLAGLMKKDAAFKIQIAGHTDNTGNAAANQSLSQRRANAVTRILVDKYGVAADRLSAEGYGPIGRWRPTNRRKTKRSIAVSKS